MHLNVYKIYIQRKIILVKVRRALVKSTLVGGHVRISATYFGMCPKLSQLVNGEIDSCVDMWQNLQWLQDGGYTGFHAKSYRFVIC